MKKLFFILMALVVLGACSKDEKQIDDDPGGGSGDEYDRFWGYRVKDTVGLKLFGGGGIPIMDNDTCNALCGIKNNKLWIGIYDSDTKDEKFVWSSANNYDLTQIKDMGYGESVTVHIDRMNISSIYVQDEKNFSVLFFSFEGSPSIKNIWNLLFVHNGKETFHRDVKYYIAMPWYDNSIIVSSGNESPRHTTIFSSAGNKLFDLYPYSSFWELEPVSIEEGVCVRIGLNSLYEGSYRSNIKTGEKVWETDIYFDDIQKNAKTELVKTKVEGNIWFYTLNITNYDGSKETRNFKINIDNGELTKL